MRPLSATARLQFHRGFTLDDAAGLVPYFAELGISHLYASPLMKSRSGSMHGYDVVDYGVVNPDLGGEAALRRLVAELRRHGMGLILDIVPNHMGVGDSDNAWWLDVLEWGRASPFAEVFDIDWDPPDPAQRGRLLAPFLGSPYGECLERGELVLRFDDTDGRLFVEYYGNRFPITPRDYSAVLLTEGGRLETPARLFTDLGTGRAEMRRQAEEARQELLQPEYRAAIDEALREYDAKTETGRDRLHRLLERQNYRLAWWRAAADEINWRRFFDVTGLAGVRAEVPEVFDRIHAKIIALYADGLIDGVRVDHVDGLAFPREYCRKLRRTLQAVEEQRPQELPRTPAVIWVEKILASHERLPSDWLTDGTTGYDFMSDAVAVLHDPAGEAPLTELWVDLTGRPAEFDVEARDARRQILRSSLSSELFATANALHRLARRDLSTRDYTLTAIRRTLQEILVHFRVYRIYSGRGGISETDRRALDWALAGARRTVRTSDLPLLDLLDGWLSGTGLRQVSAGTRRQEWLRAMVRFQQLSSPVAAKSVEDTAFYRYGRLLSRNEVGSEPAQFALSVSAFHGAMRDRRKRFPHGLLATATHDHKRGEDVRARLAVISEAPQEWEAALGRWMRLNTPLRRDVGGPAPDPAEEIMLYQTLVGAWPIGLQPDDKDGVAAFGTRVWGWFEKALREAKLRTIWTSPVPEYEEACHAFLDAVLDADRAARVVHDIAAFAARITPAGALNGLTQTLLRLTCPGVPDLYQGTERWDFSLVDPDNRRPVDFAERQAALAEDMPPPALIPHWEDGRVKQAVIHRALQFRARDPELFTTGAYQPLSVEGPQRERLIAFARTHGKHAAIVITTRLAAALPGVMTAPCADRMAWQGTTVSVPRSLVGREYSDAFGGIGRGVLAVRLPAGDLLATMPLALLEVS